MNSSNFISRCYFFIFIFTISLNISAQSNKTFFLGHSLINFDIPNMVDQLSKDNDQLFSYDANIGIGATLNWHWVSPTSGQGEQWDLALPHGGYENFIITEAVPLENHIQYSNTYQIVDSLYRFATAHNPDIQYYIYETWHCINSGNGSTVGEGGYPCSWDPNSNNLWRDRIDIDLPKWESIADSINVSHINPMLVIPGGQALGKLSDSIQNGIVPSINSIFDLFVDEYHLDSRGNYFIACVMYSVIHGISPVGLENQLNDQFGNPYILFPTVEQAQIMQKIAWETVCDYQRSGVMCEAVNTSELEINSSITIFPNPAQNFIRVDYKSSPKRESYKIYDQVGNLVLKGETNSTSTLIDVTDLIAGAYFFKTKNQTIKFIK